MSKTNPLAKTTDGTTVGEYRPNRRAWVISIASLAGVSAIRPSLGAQEGAEATIEALETEVAELEAENSDLQSQVAGDPTPTETASRTPVSDEPFVLADGLVILNYRFVHSGIYDADGDEKATWVTGEMQNLIDQTLDAPGLDFVLMDDAGNIIGNISAQPILQIIQPQQVMPFLSSIFGDEPDPSEWTKEEINLCSDWGSTNRLEEYDATGLLLEDVVADQQDDSLSFEGKVRNNRDEPADNVWIKAAIYGAEGAFVGWFWTFLQVEVPAGKTANFSFDSRGNPHDPVGVAGPGYTYELWIGPGSSFSTC
jgi:hypothetical protein